MNGESVERTTPMLHGLQFQPTLSSEDEDAYVKLKFHISTQGDTQLSIVTMMIKEAGMTITRSDMGAISTSTTLSDQTSIPLKIALVAVSDISDAETHPSLFKVGKLTVELQVDDIAVDLGLIDDPVPPVFDRIEVFHTAYSKIQMTPLC
jgi:hypothetical protein